MPPTDNPLTVAAYVAGLLLSVPLVVAAVRAIFFVAKASTKLDKIDEINAKLEALLAERRDTVFSLYVLETDVNALQRHAGLPERPFPDRRSGIDRRAG